MSLKSIISRWFSRKNPKTLTKKQLQGHIDTALKDAAKFYKCKIDELEYRVDKQNLIHVRPKKK